jgi:hypothetical protein
LATSSVACAFFANVIAFSIEGLKALAFARVVLILPFSIKEDDRFASNEILCAVFTPS